ncbi:D-alanyl-D-alanine carboxypeptidase/D-alanyl-D-alanine-endopeptidase [Seohaeicola zhoushanensis]
MLTTLYALEALGAEHRFRTRALATGPIRNGVLQGDLVLAGGGDPTLSTDDLAEIAAQLKARGLREVRGDFLVWDGALPYEFSIDAEQPEQLGYSPAVSGIALNYNRVYFEWKRAGKGYAVSMDARTERYRPEVAMAEMKLADRAMPVYTYADRGGRDSWSVSARALGRDGGRWLPVRKPADYAGDVFRTLARAHGIVLKAPKVTRDLPGGEVLAEKVSPPLAAILRDMLKWSTNLTAEMVGMAATAARDARPPASLRASAEAMSRWAATRYGMQRTAMRDHSGLSDDSRMCVNDLLGALVAAQKSGALRPLLKTIPVRDPKGKVVRKPEIHVDAKTGTLNYVSGLGGFMTASDGTELAFVIFSADTRARNRMSQAEREGSDATRHWNGRAKMFQQKLIARWGTLYGS